MKKLLPRFLLMGAVLAAAAFFDALWAGAPPTPLWPALMRGLFGLVFLLGWRFRRGRYAWVALLLAGVAELALRGLLVPGSPLHTGVALLLPLDLALVAWWGEWWVLSQVGLSRLALLGAQGFALVLLSRPELAGLEALLRAPFLELGGELPLSQPAVAAFVLAALLVALRLAKRRGVFELALLGVLGCGFAALARPSSGSLYLAAGGVIAALALVEGAFSLAFEDGLTGLPARRALEENLRHLGRRYAIAMVDLDHFKRLNDRHGHEVGDQVLRRVATKLGAVGGGGRAFRYGGEEFTVIFPGSSVAEARPHLEELREQIAGDRFTVRGPERPKRPPASGRGKGGAGPRIAVTVSIGVAERSEKRPSPEAVIKAADKALYRSKRGGRNRVTVGR